MELYILLLTVVLLTVVLLALYVIFYKDNGVKQRVRVYGLFYYIRTVVYINNKLFQSWNDVADTQKQMEEVKEERRKQAQSLFDTVIERTEKIKKYGKY